MAEAVGTQRDQAPGTTGWLVAETVRLLDFAEGSWDPLGGFGRQDDAGVRAPGAPAELWITGRMTHVYALGTMLGHPTSPELLQHGLTALGGRLRDLAHGGWFPEVDSGGPVRTDKECYQHMFVVLAASSATVAGHPRAAELLDYALHVVDQRFWSADAGMLAESWDASFTESEPYRGVNANMHGVEAMLAAFDATGAEVWRDRALRVTERVVREFAEPNDWRIPEHFDPDWHPLLDYNRDRPDDPFRPYGSTVGHGLEWSRLCLQVAATVGDRAPGWLAEAARQLFDRAVADGWAVDGADGFVYTVDWDGSPVVHQRMHWVLAEAIGAASTLHAVTGEDRYQRWCVAWWEYAERYLLDRKLGSWHHELDRENRPAATVWPGKADAYHAVQATLLPRLPVRGSIAAAVRAGM
ncbi:MAG TPA: AGE family epimerase/isomerase [Pseudonocardia sp.]|jgi:mannose/cellobiose epimerase-like protein (N-acyl-D-glucosamine 2-epimerase family)